MRWRMIVIAVSALLLVPEISSARSRGRLAFLTEPRVQWKADRLSGELRDVPVGAVLEELLRGRAYDCKVDGVLQGTLTIHFENLTPEELIRRIMYTHQYNFTMIETHPEASDAGGVAGVSRLTVYQGDTTVRFTRVPVSAARTVQKRPLPAGSASGVESPRTIPDTDGKIDALDQEIKTFLDNMLTSDKITREEYDKALKEVIGTRN